MEKNIKVYSEQFESFIERLDKFERRVLDAIEKRQRLSQAKWLDSEEMCAILKCNKRTLQNYRDGGAIPYTFFTPEGKRYYNADEIEAILFKNATSVCKDL